MHPLSRMSHTIMYTNIFQTFFFSFYLTTIITTKNGIKKENKNEMITVFRWNNMSNRTSGWYGTNVVGVLFAVIYFFVVHSFVF